MKALKQCVNGCDAPPQPPSKVLCSVCLEKLSAKMFEMGRRWQDSKPARDKGEGET